MNNTRFYLSGPTGAYATASGTANIRFRVPLEYKKIHGFFLYNQLSAGKREDIKQQQMTMMIDKRTIIPQGFDAELLEFSTFLPYKDIAYKLDMPNNNEEFEIDIYTTLESGKSVNYKPMFYFIVER